MKRLTVEQVRAEFPITRECVYLDTAYHGPFPTRAANAIKEFAEGKSTQPFPNGRQDVILQRVETIRGKVAALLGVSESEIWFPKSTTDAQAIVASALLRPGDQIVVGGLEHPANYTVWAALAGRGVKVTVVPHRNGRMDPADIESALTPSARAIGLCLVNTYNGYRQDLGALQGLARRHGLYLVLDAIQGMGHLNIDLSSGDVTSMAAGAYKWFCAPEGLAVAYLNRKVVASITPERVHFYNADVHGPEGWKGVIASMLEHGHAQDKPFDLEPGMVSLRGDARRLESAPSVVSLIGLEAVVDIMTEFGGMKAVEKRVLELGAKLRAALAEHGHMVISDTDPAHMSGITSVQVTDGQAFAAFASTRGVHVPPVVATKQGAQAVRVSPHFFNNEEDIAAFVEAMNAFRAKRG